jgi:hypothetical protein
LQLRPWRPISNFLCAIHPPLCLSRCLNIGRGPRIVEQSRFLLCSQTCLSSPLSGSPHRPSGASTHQLGWASTGVSWSVSASLVASLVASASGLVAPSAFSPPPCRITGARLCDHHGLVKWPLEDLARGPGCPCRCLLFPHLFGLDAYVVYLLLAGVNLVAGVGSSRAIGGSHLSGKTLAS